MTVIVSPRAEPKPDEVQALFEEARQRRRKRRSLAAIGILTVSAGVVIGSVSLAGRGSPPKQSSPPSSLPGRLRPAAGSSRCRNGQLRLTTLGSLHGAGNLILVLGFVNASETSCTLAGYPKVAALDIQGTVAAVAKPILNGVGGVPTGTTSPPTVTLKPGQTSSATISGSEVPPGTATSCPWTPGSR